MSAATEPQEGDHIILRGTIKTIHEGVALVEVYRTYPVGGRVSVQCGALELDESEHDGGMPAVSTELSDAYGSFRRNNTARDYAARHLAEIKTRNYPNGDTLQMIADFEWLIDEVEYLRRTSDECQIPADGTSEPSGPCRSCVDGLSDLGGECPVCDGTGLSTEVTA